MPLEAPRNAVDQREDLIAYLRRARSSSPNGNGEAPAHSREPQSVLKKPFVLGDSNAAETYNALVYRGVTLDRAIQLFRIASNGRTPKTVRDELQLGEGATLSREGVAHYLNALALRGAEVPYDVQAVVSRILKTGRSRIEYVLEILHEQRDLGDRETR